MINLHDPLNQAILGIALTFVLWGVDKVTDKDNLEAISSISPKWNQRFATKHPNFSHNVNTVIHTMLYAAGVIYFIGGLYLLHEIGTF